MINTSYLIQLLFSAIAALISLSIHEYSHAFAANKLGDPTAKSLGRLTVNPIKHLDPIGALCMVFFRFGWAKPVPISPRYFKNPKRDFAITALAGPLSNLITAVFSAFIYLLTYACLKNVRFANELTLNIAQNTLDFIWIFHIVNVGLAVFNLIPVPPLDGSRILNVVLPPKAYFGIMKHERTIYYALIGWLLLGDAASRYLLSLPLVASNGVLSAVATYVSLSNILGILIDGLSGAIFYLFELIPFLST